MDLISLVIVIIVIGVVLWLVNTYIPMDPKIKNVLNIVVIVALVIWILGIFLGGWSGIEHIHIGR